MVSEQETKRPAATSVFLFSVIVALALTPGLARGGVKGQVADPKVTVLKAVPTADVVTIEEFALPTAYSSPYAIVVDKKDRIWFTETAGNNIAVFDPGSRVLKEYRIPSTKDLPESDWKYDPSNKTMPDKIMNVYSVGGPGNLVIDKDGIVWTVLLLGNSIVRFDPEKEEFVEFLLPTPNSQPHDIAADSKGRIWFVEKNGGKLGYLDPSTQKVGEMSIGAGSSPMGIAVDDKDDVWIGEVNGNYIGRYQFETKIFKKFTISSAGAQPGHMRFDKSGKLWFTQQHTKQLGVFMPGAGAFSVVDLVGYNAVPQALTVSADDRIWVVDSMMGQVGYFDQVSMKWGIFEIAGGGHSQPMGITTDSKGDIWFTEGGMANKIARLVRKTVPAAAGVIPKAGAEADIKKIADDEERGKTSWLYKYGAGALAALLVVAGALVVFKSRSRKD
jgi:streptogramin lyase